MYKIYCPYYTLVLDDCCKVLCAFGSEEWLADGWRAAEPLRYCWAYDTWAPKDYWASKVRTSEGLYE